MEVVKKALDYIEKAVAQISKFLLITLLLLAVYQVFSRYVLNYSFSWTEEISRYLLMWLIMLTSSILVREKSHAAIMILIEKISPRRRIYMEILVSIISLVFVAILFYQGLMMAWEVKGILSSAARIPMTAVYLCIPVGTLLMMIFFIENIITSLLAGKPRKE